MVWKSLHGNSGQKSVSICIEVVLSRIPSTNLTAAGPWGYRYIHQNQPSGTVTAKPGRKQACLPGPPPTYLGRNLGR